MAEKIATATACALMLAVILLTLHGVYRVSQHNSPIPHTPESTCAGWGWHELPDCEVG